MSMNRTWVEFLSRDSRHRSWCSHTKSLYLLATSSKKCFPKHTCMYVECADSDHPAYPDSFIRAFDDEGLLFYVPFNII